MTKDRSTPLLRRAALALVPLLISAAAMVLRVQAPPQHPSAASAAASAPVATAAARAANVQGVTR